MLISHGTDGVYRTPQWAHDPGASDHTSASPKGRQLFLLHLPGAEVSVDLDASGAELQRRAEALLQSISNSRLPLCLKALRQAALRTELAALATGL